MPAERKATASKTKAIAQVCDSSIICGTRTPLRQFKPLLRLFDTDVYVSLSSRGFSPILKTILRKISLTLSTMRGASGGLNIISTRFITTSCPYLVGTFDIPINPEQL